MTENFDIVTLLTNTRYPLGTSRCSSPDHREKLSLPLRVCCSRRGDGRPCRLLRQAPG
jgi:hypothetical protein